MEAIERVCKFLKEAETYYLATVEGGSAPSAALWYRQHL